MNNTPYSFIIHPHAQISVIWKPSLDEALLDISKTMNEGQTVYVQDLMNPTIPYLLEKSDGKLILR